MKGSGKRMDHKLDKDYLDQLIIEKKHGLNEENFSNWKQVLLIPYY